MDLEQLQRLHQKPLSNTDINGLLAFPVRLIHHVWGPNDPPEKYFKVMNRFGKEWGFKAHMRWGQDGHRRPEVQGPEWKRFVKLNKLKVHDELVFYRHPDPNPTQVVFVVSVTRELTLMGETFSAHIDLE